MHVDTFSPIEAEAIAIQEGLLVYYCVGTWALGKLNWSVMQVRWLMHSTTTRKYVDVYGF